MTLTEIARRAAEAPSEAVARAAMKSTRDFIGGWTAMNFIDRKTGIAYGAIGFDDLADANTDPVYEPWCATRWRLGTKQFCAFSDFDDAKKWVEDSK